MSSMSLVKLSQYQVSSGSRCHGHQSTPSNDNRHSVGLSSLLVISFVGVSSSFPTFGVVMSDLDGPKPPISNRRETLSVPVLQLRALFFASTVEIFVQIYLVNGVIAAEAGSRANFRVKEEAYDLERLIISIKAIEGLASE